MTPAANTFSPTSVALAVEGSAKNPAQLLKATCKGLAELTTIVQPAKLQLMK
jgi:hypothetical protein